ncbi:MAG: nuclear transport factor 2 family protein [Chloroflexi bacterium]|nr:nuclear transport factor 2 family protein [Chloroflexota bacterium]
MAAARPKTKPASKARVPLDPDKLVRQEAGTYRTADGRFAVRSDRPGAWYVTDGLRVDGFGLELTLGPVATRAATAPLITAQRAEARGTAAGTTPEGVAVPEEAVAVPEPARAYRPPRRASEPTPASTVESAPQPPPATQPEPEPMRVVLPRRRRTGDERDEVADVSRAMSDAWATGQPGPMESHLHPSMVMLTASRGRITGRKAALSSYLDQTRPGRLRAYEESDVTVDAWADTAVVTSSFAIERDADGVPDIERGKQQVVFARIDGSWLAVWRSVTSDRQP